MLMLVTTMCSKNVRVLRGGINRRAMRVEHHAVAHLAIFAAAAPQPRHPTSKIRMQKRSCERRDQCSLELKRRLQALLAAATAASADVHASMGGRWRCRNKNTRRRVVVRGSEALLVLIHANITAV
jgi:hypothetical protein